MAVYRNHEHWLTGKEWSRRESNPCPKNHSLSFYYHSVSINIPSAVRGNAL